MPDRSMCHTIGSTAGGEEVSLAARPVAISAFGPMTLWFPSGPVEPGPPRWRAVLALLLVNAGKVVSTSSLIRSVWETDPPGHAVTTLQSYVSRLRGLLGEQPLRGGVEARVEYRSPGYVLRVEPDRVDVPRFESMVARTVSARSRGDLAQCFVLASEALRLWTAPPFEDLADYRFAVQEAVRLDRLRLTAVEAQAAAALSLNRGEEILPGLEREVARHPTHERLVCRLMQAQCHNGRQADALRLFDRTRRLLAGELGADAGPELRRTHEEILRHGCPPARPPLTPAPQAAPEPGPAGAAGAAKALARTGPGPSSLEPAGPPPVRGAGASQGFVGREKELRRLLAALASALDGEGRTVLLVGEAGLGKTRLVREFGRRCRGAGADVVTVGCPPAEGMPPYWIWAQALRMAAARRPEGLLDLPEGVRHTLAALVPDLVPGCTDRPALTDVSGFELHDAVSQAVLAPARRPLVLVLEDVQWADADSLSLLPFLTRQSTDAPFLLVVTSRSFRIADDPALRATRAAVLQSLNAEEIRLGGLRSEDSRGIVARVLGPEVDDALCAELHERAAGNPFMLLGLVDALPAGATARAVRDLVPTVIQEVVSEQLSAIPREVRELLDSCAAGARERITGAVTRGTVRRAVRGELLVLDEAAPGGIGFAHPLIRDVLRQELAQTEPFLRGPGDPRGPGAGPRPAPAGDGDRDKDTEGTGSRDTGTGGDRHQVRAVVPSQAHRGQESHGTVTGTGKPAAPARGQLVRGC
ncbi:BTAD domain-containing putative transcriptional regulator [Streptomyces sp. NPDC048717]|uniref:BTAD domain-containing putative transcriptional regulator n=1 Tax=Streptomyces sp. NPDC048717 TaxID=3154928 RepID=UPI003414C848